MFHESQEIGLYTLIRKLGEGGFGEVWLAENRNNSPSEKVAIKLPRKDQIDLQAVKEEIFNWTLSGKHKNILPIIECETFGNQIAIISEFAPDGSLQDLINKKGSLPIAEAVEFTIGILDGLAHLHNRQIIHRDLKPDNVLFQGKIPRLTDFGISRAMAIGSQSQTVSGTLSYMAPEAFDGKRNAQTDIWAVGVILYQLLTGSLPFPQKEFIELIGALARQKPAPLPDSIPPVLQTIVKKVLAKELSDRYQTAAEMAKELREFSQKNSEETLEIPSNPILPTEPSPKIVVGADNHQPVTESLYPQDSVATQVKESESILIQPVKRAIDSQSLPQINSIPESQSDLSVKTKVKSKEEVIKNIPAGSQKPTVKPLLNLQPTSKSSDLLETPKTFPGNYISWSLILSSLILVVFAYIGIIQSREFNSLFTYFNWKTFVGIVFWMILLPVFALVFVVGFIGASKAINSYLMFGLNLLFIVIGISISIFLGTSIFYLIVLALIGCIAGSFLGEVIFRYKTEQQRFKTDV